MNPLLIPLSMSMLSTANIPSKLDWELKQDERREWWYKIGRHLPRKAKKQAKNKVLMDLNLFEWCKQQTLDLTY